MAIGGVISPSGSGYLPLTGGTVTGALTVKGGITGNLTGKATSAAKADTADKAANADNATKAENAAKADSATDSTKWGGMSLRLQNKTSVGDFLMPVFTTTTDMDYISSRQLFEQIMQLVWPVGSVYHSTDPANPRDFFGGTWESIASERVLMGTSDSHPAGSTVNAGLPNITGAFNVECPKNGVWYNGAFGAGAWANDSGKYGMSGGGSAQLSFDASRSSGVYGRSNTVQPAAYYVYIWRRTA